MRKGECTRGMQNSKFKIEKVFYIILNSFIQNNPQPPTKYTP